MIMGGSSIGTGLLTTALEQKSRLGSGLRSTGGSQSGSEPVKVFQCMAPAHKNIVTESITM